MNSSSDFKETEHYYNSALNLAEKCLDEIHPLRLGLFKILKRYERPFTPKFVLDTATVTNFMVFCNDCLKNPKKACELGQKYIHLYSEEPSNLQNLSQNELDSVLLVRAIKHQFNQSMFAGKYTQNVFKFHNLCSDLDKRQESFTEESLVELIELAEKIESWTEMCNLGL